MAWWSSAKKFLWRFPILTWEILLRWCRTPAWSLHLESMRLDIGWVSSVLTDGIVLEISIVSVLHSDSTMCSSHCISVFKFILLINYLLFPWCMAVFIYFGRLPWITTLLRNPLPISQFPPTSLLDLGSIKHEGKPGTRELLSLAHAYNWLKNGNKEKTKKKPGTRVWTRSSSLISSLYGYSSFPA